MLLLDVEARQDERGLFARIFDEDILARAGAQTQFPQHSIAYNTVAGTLRGLHYQVGAAEAKIVRCTRGALFDVIVDLRRGSATYAKWIGVDLDQDSRRAVYIPPGCAHGYQTVRDCTEAMYLISVQYNADDARGINYADTELKIAWPAAVTSISARDRALPSLRTAELP